MSKMDDTLKSLGCLGIILFPILLPVLVILELTKKY